MEKKKLNMITKREKNNTHIKLRKLKKIYINLIKIKTLNTFLSKKSLNSYNFLQVIQKRKSYRSHSEAC